MTLLKMAYFLQHLAAVTIVMGILLILFFPTAPYVWELLIMTILLLFARIFIQKGLIPFIKNFFVD